MSARTLAKSVMMMQRRSKQIRSAEAKQKHSAVSIGGEMARGSRHAVVAAAYLLLCEKEYRQALGAKSERNALVRSAGERRRSSRAAMWAGDDGWMAAGRFSHFRFSQDADDRPKSLAPLAWLLQGGVGFAAKGRGSLPRDAFPNAKARNWGLSYFLLERSFEAPRGAQLMLCSTGARGRGAKSSP